MTWLLLGALGGVGALSGGCDLPARPSQLLYWIEELPPVPEPAQLDESDRSVREGFAARRTLLEEALARSRGGAGEDEPTFQGEDVHRVAMAYGALGDFALAYRQFGVARVAYENARTLEPKDARWAYLLGVVLRGLGDVEAALQALEAAIEIDPLNVEILLQWAELRIENDQREGVQSRLDRILGQDPAHPVALQLQARVQDAAGETSAAIESLRRAHEAAPYASDIRYALSQLLRDEGELEEAEALLEGVDVGGSGREVRVALPWLDRVRALQRGVRRLQREGQAAYRAGRLPEALERFTEAAELAPENALPQLNRMLVLVELGRLDEAEAQRERLRELAPDHRQLLYLSARIEAARGDQTASMRELRRAIEVDPGFTPARAELARLAYRSGDLREGREQFGVVQSLAPESETHRLHWLVAEATYGRIERACEMLADSLGEPMPAVLATGAVRVLAVAPEHCGRDEGLVRRIARELYRADDSVYNAESVAWADAATARWDEAVRIQQQIVAQLEQRVEQGRAGSRADLARAAQRLDAYRTRRMPRSIWSDDELETLGFLEPMRETQSGPVGGGTSEDDDGG